MREFFDAYDNDNFEKLEQLLEHKDLSEKNIKYMFIHAVTFNNVKHVEHLLKSKCISNTIIEYAALIVVFQMNKQLVELIILRLLSINKDLSLTIASIFKISEKKAKENIVIQHKKGNLSNLSEKKQEIMYINQMFISACSHEEYDVLATINLAHILYLVIARVFIQACILKKNGILVYLIFEAKGLKISPEVINKELKKYIAFEQGEDPTYPMRKYPFGLLLSWRVPADDN